VGTGRTGTGAAITFGAQTGAGTYTVVANNLISGCTANMTGAGTISVAPIPLVTTVTGGGAYCSGGAGVAIGITASVVGANYRLYRDTVAIDTPVAGPGRGFDFALQTIPGTYTVIATFPGTSCSSTMSGSATVSINSLPIVYAVTGGGEFCANGLGAHIGLSNGDLGVRYFLSGPGGTVNTIGHNTVLDFGEFTVPGVYKAFGKNSITGCLSYMKDSAIVIRDSVPTISAKRVEVMPGGTVNLTGTPTGGIWTSFVPAIATVGSTSGIVTGVAMGYTPITYTLPNGCHDKLNIYVTATGGLSVGQVNGNMNLNIIPNPNNGAFVLKGTLDIAVSDVAVELTNATGQVVYKDNVALNNGELNKEIKLTGMPAGVYFLQARTETNHTTLRLVIQ